MTLGSAWGVLRVANFKTNAKGVSSLHYRDVEGIQRSITVGPRDDDDEYLFRFVWDTAMAHGRATQGRRQGKPLSPKPEPIEPPAPEYLGVRESIDALLAYLKEMDVPNSTYLGTKSCLNMLVEALGTTWDGWCSGYYRALDDVPNKGTRRGRSRAANRLADHHLEDIPDFRKKTKKNRPQPKTVAENRRDKAASKGKTVKPFRPDEAVPMLAILPGVQGLPEYMRLMTLVAAYMAMHRIDAFNLLTLTTPKGARATRIDWAAGTYFACRQKSSSYLLDVPIPTVVLNAIEPYRKGTKLVYPFRWPGAAGQYRKGHADLEIAAGVEHIYRRSISGWRHHFISTLSCDLGVSDVVIKALIAQTSLEGEKIAIVEGKVDDDDVLNVYKHAWPTALRAASDAFEAHMAKLIAEHMGKGEAADEGVA